MSIRLTALYIFITFLAIYAWKDWFKSLCGLILLTAFVMHPGFPESFSDIQGLNLWNIVFFSVFLAWLVNRRRQGFFWDMPTSINVFLALWLGLIVVGCIRLLVDRSALTDVTLVGIISDELINTIKWPLLCLPLFDGCRTHHRMKLALVCICLLFALFTIQIAMTIPPSTVLERTDTETRGKLTTELGISPNEAAKMMSGVPWAMLAVIPVLKKRKYTCVMLGACGASLYAVALTGGRSGYIACAATLFFLCLIRWKRYLLLLPLLVLILSIAVPGVAKRMTEGFGETDVAGDRITNKYNVTAGRSLIWPVVISKIKESPVIGFGREGMKRTGLQWELGNTHGLETGVAVGHPHNAYLEVLLDNGLIGLVIVVSLHGYLFVYSKRLFADRADPLYTAAGGFALALLIGALVANMGGQSFYPEEIHVGLWCSMGVMLRAYVARQASYRPTEPSINWQHAYCQRHYGFTNAIGGGQDHG